MATYTILRSSRMKNQSDLVIEFAVPAGNNLAEPPRTWQSVVAEVRAEAGEVGTMNPTKSGDAAHIANLDAGQIVEIPLTAEYSANLGNPAKVAVMDTAVTAEVARFTAEFGSLYRLYGTVRTV